MKFIINLFHSLLKHKECTHIFVSPDLEIATAVNFFNLYSKGRKIKPSIKCIKCGLEKPSTIRMRKEYLDGIKKMHK